MSHIISSLNRQLGVKPCSKTNHGLLITIFHHSKIAKLVWKRETIFFLEKYFCGLVWFCG